MDLRLYLAILVGKITTKIIGIFASSGATAAPGLYALKIDPQLVKKLSKNFGEGSILVSGTNGKTTTTRLIYNLLQKDYKILHNRQGSNLLRGIASTLIKNCTLTGSTSYDLGLWEVDEAVLPIAIKNCNPTTVVLLNLFRDQLDRYGEVETVRNNWQSAVKNLNKNTLLVLNTDDPGLNYLKTSFNGKVINFGINNKQITQGKVKNIKDVINCPVCSEKLEFSTHHSSHMGLYKCTNCDFSRPNPKVSAGKIVLSDNLSSEYNIRTTNVSIKISSHLPGIYNIYNQLAAASVAINFGINLKNIKYKIESYQSAFGRFQKIKIKGKKVIIFLTKNPTGTNEVIKVLSLFKNLNILVILNDKLADGQDVSWIWDTDWEAISQNIHRVFVAGTRAWDMSNRLKYANIKLGTISVNKKINYSFDKSLDFLNSKDTLFVLSTYTSMLDFQKILESRGYLKWYQN